MRVTIPDKLADHYQAIANRQGRTLDDILTAQLERFQHCAPGERTIALPTAAIDAILGGTPVLDGPDLLRRLGNLASITFDGIKLDFSPAQLKELQHRADRNGTSVEKLAKDIVSQIQKQFFWGADAPSNFAAVK